MAICVTKWHTGALLIMKNNCYKIIFIFLLIQNRIDGIQHTNFFEPYEFLLDLDRISVNHHPCSWELGVRFEGGFNFKGFPIDLKDSLVQSYNAVTIKSNPAQYINLIESDFASFFGNNTQSNLGQFVQQYTPYQGVTASQLIQFEGELELNGITGSVEYWFNKHIKLGYYLPFYAFNLKSLNNQKNNKNQFYENTICNNIYETFQENNSPAVPYTQVGLGDSQLLLSWQHYFFENRDFITGLFATLRAGLYLSTARGKEEYSKTFLKIPLGYDCSWGIPFGGSIEIDIGCYGGAGIAADCITFFPSLMNRTIKTDMRQTDMLICNESISLLEPGFRESFSVFLTGHDENRSLLGTLAYQYSKQNESDIILCQTDYPNLIAQTADLLESWTTHNLIFVLGGIKNNIDKNSDLKYECFLKYGFQGCRAIVCNSFGFQITLSY